MYGEQGADTIYLLNDGVMDLVFCGPVEDGDRGDTVIQMGGEDPLDDIRNCPGPHPPTKRLTLR